MPQKTFFEKHKTGVAVAVVTGAIVLVLPALFMLGGYLLGYMPYGSQGFKDDGVFFERGIAGDMQVKSPFALRGTTPEGLSVLPPVPPPFLGGILDDRQIIQNGSLSLVVKRAEDAIQGVREIATRLTGFVDNANIYETGEDKKAGTITIRVPSKDFNEAMTAIKSLAIKVERESVSARDVTQQVVDLDIRLKNMKAEEEQYRTILKSAEKIEDILNVTQRINNVRQRIESLQGQKDYLSRQVGMSTITVSVVSEADVKVLGVVWSPFAVVKEAVRDGLQSIVNYVDSLIFILFSLPAFALWIATVVFVFWFGWKVIVCIKRKIWGK